MRHFIEQFYYGNIKPQERSTKMNKSAQKQLEIMVNSEQMEWIKKMNNIRQRAIEIVNEVLIYQ